MIHILLLVAAFGLTILVLRKKRSLKEESRDKEVLYYFLKSSLEFLVPFTFVLFFYLGLLVVVSLAWESISLQSLIRLEEYLTTIHSYTKWKLSKVMVLCLFVGIYVLGLLRMPLETRKRLYGGVDRLYTWTKRAYVVFVLLCSFSLLGTQLGAVSDDLRLRIKLTRDGYAEFRQETEKALSEDVAFQLHTKARDTLPSAYQTALKRPEEIGSQGSALRSHYAKAQSEYGVKSSKAESVLNRIEARSKSNLQTEIRLPSEASTKRTTVSEPDASQITYRKVKEAKTAVENYRQKTRGRFISFLSTEDGKRLTVQGAKVATDILKSQLVSSWIKAYPISELFIDVFFKTMDETTKGRVDSFADNVARSIVQNLGSTETAINEGTSRIVNQTEIKISPEIMQQAEQSGRQLEEELANINAARVEVDTGIQQVKDSRTEKMIAELKSSNKSVRETAAEKLSATADISQAKVNKLISIMRNGSQTWITRRYRNEGHRCTDYEYTSIRYYAATALADMKSPHVTQEIVREARRCQGDSVTTKTVTDPGWI